MGMKIAIIGAAGFIGTNLALQLIKTKENQLTLVDKKLDYFAICLRQNNAQIQCIEDSLDQHSDFAKYLVEQDVIYHLFSTTVPATSNHHVSQELIENVVFTAKLLDECLVHQVKKVVFVSSGGTVYGKELQCPLPEETPTKPITSYGIQKGTIERLLYLYRYMHGLDYRIIRLANPYGPYQRPNGILGAVTTFTYKALNRDKITVYGDGSVIRDYIYIDDAIRAILNIANGTCEHRTFNVGCGCGISVNDLLNSIQSALEMVLDIEYVSGRSVDVPVNYLDITRYEKYYGKLQPISLEEGIKKTANFMRLEKMIVD